MTGFAERFAKTEKIYLLSHSVGLMPSNAEEHLQQNFFEPWRASTSELWDHWLGSIEGFRAALGELFGVTPQSVCPQPNVSAGLSKILYGLDFEKKGILLSEKSFPSLGFVGQVAASSGVTLTFVPSHEDVTDPEVWAKYLNDDIGIVLVTHVHSNTNERSPVPEVIKMARDSNAISIIDICQSAGVVPIDLSLWNPDFAIGSCLKWLCGGPGAGYLWVNDNMLDRCRPVDVGWFSHESPFEFDIHNFRYAQDALRFWGGTPTIAPFVLATNSINLILSLGVQEIQRHNRRLTELLISQVARACHLICPREPDRRGGSVVLDFGAQQTAVADRLAQRGIVCDGRADGMRLSPHIYNSHEQIQTVVAALLDQT